MLFDQVVSKDASRTSAASMIRPLTSSESPVGRVEITCINSAESRPERKEAAGGDVSHRRVEQRSLEYQPDGDASHLDSTHNNNYFSHRISLSLTRQSCLDHRECAMNRQSSMRNAPLTSAILLDPRLFVYHPTVAPVVAAADPLLAHLPLAATAPHLDLVASLEVHTPRPVPTLSLTTHPVPLRAHRVARLRPRPTLRTLSKVPPLLAEEVASLDRWPQRQLVSQLGRPLDTA